MAYTFRGGIHPGTKNDPGFKAATNKKPIEVLKAPDKVILPVSMHIGAPAKPLVKKGDIVNMGQMIAEAGGFVSAPVHASVSGKVVDVVPMLHQNGSKVLSIVIENDHEDRLDESVKPKDFEAMSNDERIQAIWDAGIVGHGGATFPTHVKIKSGIGKCDTILINGAECEPYITSDHRLLLERPEEIVEGVRYLVKIMGVKKAYIGIELNKQDTFAGIEKLIAGDPVIELAPLECRYPQGAEKQLINAVTGREVPSGKLPADAGCAVFNVDTAGAVYRCFAKGMPVIRRVVTISGSAVAEPKNLEARTGTLITELIDACGGFKAAPNKLLAGGPMMGNAQFTTDVPVLKGTNAFLAMAGDEDKRVKNPTCIRCGRCVEACPMHLEPLYLYMYEQKGMIEELEAAHVMDCIECGACSYICPGRLHLTHAFKAGKQKVKDAAAKAKAAAEAAKAAEDAKKEA